MTAPCLPDVKLTDLKAPLSEALIVPLAQTEPNSEINLPKLPPSITAAITATINQGLFKAEVSECYALSDTQCPHILLVGMGEPSKSDAAVLTKSLTTAVHHFKGQPVETCTVMLSACTVLDKTPAWVMKKGIETCLAATYTFHTFKSKPDPKEQFHIKSFELPTDQKSAYEKLALEAEATALGMALMRDLGHTPSNHCTPQTLAEIAEKLATEFGSLSATILDEPELAEIGCHALLSVGQGSHIPSKLITLEYNGLASEEAPIVLVGKGVCFDTGGYSLKAPKSMINMKYDMCGAASVLGTMAALAKAQCPIRVIGLIPTVMNMVDSTAYKPDDIIGSLSGKTIEVTNTDAEGRLILCDALTYAQQHFNPKYLIDVATLTGAIVIALGSTYAGLFSNDEHLSQALVDAGKQAHDPVWPMPTHPDFHRALESPFADMVNGAPTPAGGSATAASFLEKFIDSTPWAHLDIAGIAMPNDKSPLLTGRPIPLLLEFILTQCQH